MPKYVIERTVPGAGAMSSDQLRELAGHSNDVLRQLAGHSNDVLRQLAPDVQWVHSYVAGDKIYCVYNATDAEMVREHGRRGGFPVDLVTPVAAVIDPTTAEV